MSTVKSVLSASIVKIFNMSSTLNNNIALSAKGNFTQSAFDLPNIVNIFQALGFNTCMFDISQGDHNKPQKIRITVTCNISGQRCVLEKINEKEVACSCVNSGCDNIPEGYILEPTPNKQKELIPKLEKKQVVAIKSTMDHVFRLTRDGDVPMPDFVNGISVKTCLNNGEALCCINRARIDNGDDMAEAPITETENNIPFRHRSLDSLTSKTSEAGDELPEPGALIPKIVVDTTEVSNSSIPDNKEKPNGLFVVELLKSANVIKSASEHIIEAINAMESNAPQKSYQIRVGGKFLNASNNIQKLVSTNRTTLKQRSSPNLPVLIKEFGGVTFPKKKLMKSSASLEDVYHRVKITKSTKLKVTSSQAAAPVRKPDTTKMFLNLRLQHRVNSMKSTETKSNSAC